MRNPILGAKFRRDVKLAQRRGKDMSKLRALILLLIEGNLLPPRYKDHTLAGAWKRPSSVGPITPDMAGLPVEDAAGDSLGRRGHDWQYLPYLLP